MDRVVSVVILAPLEQARAWGDALGRAGDVEVQTTVEHPADLRPVVEQAMPDVVLIDLATADLEVVALCAELTDVVPIARILLVGPETDAPVDAVAAGASGATSASVLDDIAGVVRRVARGEGVVTRSWAAALIEGDATRFTATEREVLQRLAKGATVDSVAVMHEVPSHVVGLHAAYALARVQRAAADARADA